jgi:hypothetical protein
MRNFMASKLIISTSNQLIYNKISDHRQLERRSSKSRFLGFFNNHMKFVIKESMQISTFVPKIGKLKHI